MLVDLFRAVRQGLRASVESYSIKRMEPLYDFERREGLRDAGSSIVEFEEWLELGEGDRPVLDDPGSIQTYNEDDVRSNLALRDWLESAASCPRRGDRPGGAAAGAALTRCTGAASRGRCPGRRRSPRA